MKLLSLNVERFRCIRKAKIEFAAGLNVLHGPNDLGKSSLVHAIRAALLLQSSAKEGEAFASWYESGEPQVELVFESEPQQIWRVKKTFGTSTARLEFSKDGVDFSHEARGREVDERLTDILRWGVAPPGGKKRPKGMPETFLSAALLPDQDRVGAIFNQPLGDDSDESGRKWLISALQAMAEDPVFKRVLAKVQERVDEAFNVSDDKVAKRRGKNSPWTKLAEELNQKQQESELRRRKLEETVAVENEIQQLRERRLDLYEAARKADERKSAVVEDLERIGNRLEIEVRREEAKARLCAIATELQQLREAEAAHESESRRIAALEKKRDAARTAREQSFAQSQKAKEELNRVQSADRVRERQLEQSRLQTNKAELEVEQSKLEASLAAIGAIEAATASADRIERELREIEASAANLREKSEETAAARGDLEQEGRDLRAIRSFFLYQTAHAAMEEAEKGSAQLAEWSKQARQQRAAAAAIEAEQPRVNLPSREQIEILRRLEGDLRVAAAGTNVGLSVTLRPKRALRVSVQRDSEAPTSHELSKAPLDAAAQRRLQIDIDGIAGISVSGGAADAREQMDALEKRWAAEAAPLLKAAGVGSVEELARIVDEAANRAAEIAGATRAAEQLEQRIADQPEWGKILPDRQAALKTTEKALMGAETSKLEKSARKLKIRDASDAEKHIEAMRAKFDKIAESARQLETQFAAEDARAAEKRKSLDEARAGRDSKQAAIEGDWREAKRAAELRQVEIRKSLSTIAAKLDRLAKAGDDDLTAARAALEAAEQALQKSEAEEEAAQRESNDATLAHAKDEGALKSRLEAAARLDEQGAREALAKVEAELAAAPAPGEPATAETLAEAERALGQTNAAVEDIDGQIREKQGALQQVGGEVAKQRPKMPLSNSSWRKSACGSRNWNTAPGICCAKPCGRRSRRKGRIWAERWPIRSRSASKRSQPDATAGSSSAQRSRPKASRWKAKRAT